MTLIVDSREKDVKLLKEADEVALLEWEGVYHLSYDLHVRAEDGTDFRFERKTWTDFISSWFSKDLDRQLLAVDGLVVEYHPGVAEMAAEMEHGYTVENQERARKHLWHLQMEARPPVIVTSGVEETITFLRYLERKGAKILT